MPRKKIVLKKSDCLDLLKKQPPNIYDALLTDPPAGIAFMNKSWDKNKGGRDQWIEWLTEIMIQCNRVMKPGAHGFVWALPRTSHWTATALENAGFEIRDIVTHLFGSGFPKSMDISKAIDKQAGAERKIIGKKSTYRKPQTPNGWDCQKRAEFETAPATPEAKQWQGYGTALKPASEHWILIRKTCSEKTVAKNVLKWGVGGINIDACRVEGKKRSPEFKKTLGVVEGSGSLSGIKTPRANVDVSQGRFPANLILDDVAGEMLDAQSLAGGIHGAGAQRGKGNFSKSGIFNNAKSGAGHRVGDSGGASRFFYCAKPSKKERNVNLTGASKKVNDGRRTEIDNAFQRGETERLNTHPTVKSRALMAYLARLIAPPKGIILDPFMGSGSTGLACQDEGFGFFGIEKEKEYFEIAKKRLGV